jgi:hypothetical protein
MGLTCGGKLVGVFVSVADTVSEVGTTEGDAVAVDDDGVADT